MLSSLMGLRVFESESLTDTTEDWSQVRSPGRAKRRRWKHKQRIRYIQTPKPDVFRVGDIIVGHPETIRRLVQSMKDTP